MDEQGRQVLAAEAYGVRFGISLPDASLVSAVMATLPPLWRQIPVTAVEHWCRITAPSSTYRIEVDDEQTDEAGDEATLLHLLENIIALLVARYTPVGVAVHAGVVGWRGRAIVMPGDSMSGKSTLVHAFLAEGAQYYSDELALIDAEGCVSPYPRPIGLRRAVNGGVIRERVSPPATAVGSAPLPCGLLLVTRFEAGAQWRPRPLSPRQAVLALLQHSIAARAMPARALAACSAAVDRSHALQGPRGDAGDTARLVLGRLPW